MDLTAIMGLIVKGLGVVSTLISVGRDAAPAVKVLYDLATGAQNGTVTIQQLTAAEVTLDAMIEDFDSPIE